MRSISCLLTGSSSTGSWRSYTCTEAASWTLFFLTIMSNHLLILAGQHLLLIVPPVPSKFCSASGLASASAATTMAISWEPGWPPSEASHGLGRGGKGERRRKRHILRQSYGFDKLRVAHGRHAISGPRGRTEINRRLRPVRFKTL